MNTKVSSFLSGLAFLLIACLITSCALHKDTHIKSKNEELENAIKKSASYLKRSVKDDGMFTYRINMNPDVIVKERYNILRHAGTIYSMTQYYDLYEDDEMLRAILNTGMYLQSMITPLPDNKNLSAIWSKPEVNKTGKLLKAKLGGAGLGLVALVSIENIVPGFTSMDRLRALGDFIIYMQRDDGSFYSKYIPDMGGRSDKWYSVYYPGEAALGLLMLYDLDHQSKWLTSAIKALEYLALKSKKRGPIVDHWTLLATESLFDIENISNKLPNKKLLLDHAIQICELILDEQFIDTIQPELDGAFIYDGRTTPTSIRLEGLLAALSFIQPENPITDDIEFSVDRGISFLLRSQIKEGKFSGAIPRSAFKFHINTPSIVKLNSRATEVRIDYVQHALSAMIQYYKHLNAYN